VQVTVDERNEFVALPFGAESTNTREKIIVKSARENVK